MPKFCLIPRWIKGPFSNTGELGKLQKIKERLIRKYENLPDESVVVRRRILKKYTAVNRRIKQLTGQEVTD